MSPNSVANVARAPPFLAQRALHRYMSHMSPSARLDQILDTAPENGELFASASPRRPACISSSTTPPLMALCSSLGTLGDRTIN